MEKLIVKAKSKVQEDGQNKNDHRVHLPGNILPKPIQKGMSLSSGLYS